MIDYHNVLSFGPRSHRFGYLQLESGLHIGSLPRFYTGSRRVFSLATQTCLLVPFFCLRSRIDCISWGAKLRLGINLRRLGHGYLELAE